MMIQPINNRNNNYKPNFGYFTKIAYCRALAVAGDDPQLARRVEELAKKAGNQKIDLDFIKGDFFYRLPSGLKSKLELPPNDAFAAAMSYSERSKILDNFERAVEHVDNIRYTQETL